MQLNRLFQMKSAYAAAAYATITCFKYPERDLCHRFVGRRRAGA